MMISRAISKGCGSIAKIVTETGLIRDWLISVCSTGASETRAMKQTFAADSIFRESRRNSVGKSFVTL